MIAAIVPQFFSTDIRKTQRYYETRLGFEIQFEYGDPVFYGGVIRDGLSIFFRHVDEPLAWPGNKYEDELLDAYIRVEDAHALYETYLDAGATIHRQLAERPWGMTEFVVRDCDGRLLCFGEPVEGGD